MTPPRKGSNPEYGDEEDNSNNKSIRQIDNEVYVLKTEVNKLNSRVGELEMSVGALTGEVSESLKAIGSAPDKAKRLEGSGIARSVVEIQESVDRINNKLDEENKEKIECKLDRVAQTDTFLKKVQTIGSMITSVSGVIGIIGAAVAILFWVAKHIPH